MTTDAHVAAAPPHTNGCSVFATEFDLGELAIITADDSFMVITFSCCFRVCFLVKK